MLKIWLKNIHSCYSWNWSGPLYNTKHASQTAPYTRVKHLFHHLYLSVLLMSWDLQISRTKHSSCLGNTAFREICYKCDELRNSSQNNYQDRFQVKGCYVSTHFTNVTISADILLPQGFPLRLGYTVLKLRYKNGLEIKIISIFEWSIFYLISI